MNMSVSQFSPYFGAKKTLTLTPPPSEKSQAFHDDKDTKSQAFHNDKDTKPAVFHDAQTTPKKKNPSFIKKLMVSTLPLGAGILGSVMMFTLPQKTVTPTASVTTQVSFEVPAEAGLNGLNGTYQYHETIHGTTRDGKRVSLNVPVSWSVTSATASQKLASSFGADSSGTHTVIVQPALHATAQNMLSFLSSQEVLKNPQLFLETLQKGLQDPASFPEDTNAEVIIPGLASSLGAENIAINFGQMNVNIFN